MKREIILSLTGMGLLTGASVWAAPNLEFNQLPPAVQRSIDAHKRNAEVVKVERDVSASGGVYYEVRLKGEKGAKREFYVLENGNLVSEEQMSRPNFEFKARKRQLGQLPTAVQQTVRAQIGNAKVDSIDQLRRDGKTIYEVEYENQGKVSEFLVAQDGALITDGNNRSLPTAASATTATASRPGSGKVQFNDLPKAVQRTVKSQVGAASVEDIDRDVRDGKTTYEVAYKKNGVHTELRVAQDGSILNSSTTDANNVTAASTPLSGGAKVSMNDVPEVVRKAIAANIGTAQVEDLEKGLLNGKTVYEAAYKRNGVHTELRVAEDGTVLSGGNPSIRESAGAQLPAPVLTAPAPVATAPVTAPAANESRKVQFFELPAAVQKTVREQAGAAEIEDIDKETRNGKTVYEAAFKKDGKNTELRVNEDGSLAK